MSAWEWVRLFLGGALLLGGLLIFVVELYGAFRFKYVLNRMHAAALGDTLGITCSMAGLILLSGFHLSTLKMAMVILFLWLTSPVSSHLLARLEAGTNERLGEHCEVYGELEILEEELRRQEDAPAQSEMSAQSGMPEQGEERQPEGRTEPSEAPGKEEET